MKTKYRKFNQYIESWYGGFKVGYLPIRTWEAKRLIDSQMNEKPSEKMKKLREKRKYSKHLHNVHHHISQKDRRMLRDARRLWSFKNE